jgi:hypothetical protein
MQPDLAAAAGGEGPHCLPACQDGPRILDEQQASRTRSEARDGDRSDRQNGLGRRRRWQAGSDLGEACQHGVVDSRVQTKAGGSR